MNLARIPIGLLTAAAIPIGATAASWAQPAPSGPPAVGVVEATKRPITETSEFLGRIEAVNRVNAVTRATTFTRLTTERARILLSGPAGQQSIYDAALANQRSLEAQVQAA